MIILSEHYEEPLSLHLDPCEVEAFGKSANQTKIHMKSGNTLWVTEPYEGVRDLILHEQARQEWQVRQD